MTVPASTRAAGAGAVLLALAFNVPYALLAVRFDYPGILREEPARILAAVAEGGAPLVLTWYAFAAAAMALVPVGLGLALGGGRAAARPALAVAGAVLAGIAGLTQAMGLLRWVMAVPLLAGRPGSEGAFVALHAFAGVAVGEHLGMLATAGFVGVLAAIHRAEGAGRLAALGAVTAAAIAAGAFEGVALALGAAGGPFGLATVAGYLLLGPWLAWAGLSMARGATGGAAAPATARPQPERLRG